MPFNVSKGKVMHLGNRNQKAEYKFLGQSILEIKNRKGAYGQSYLLRKKAFLCYFKLRACMCMHACVWYGLSYLSREKVFSLFHVHTHMHTPTSAHAPTLAFSVHLREKWKYIFSWKI